MGWSCSQKASVRLKFISDLCFAATGMNNTWKHNGQSYFYEVGREQRDGAICGQIYKILPDGKAKKSSSFRIERDGRLTRGPSLFKTHFLLITIDTSSNQFIEHYKGPKPVTKENIVEYLVEWLKQFLKGGVNEITSGNMPYPNSVNVINPDTGTIFEWKAPVFMVWY